MEVTIAGRTYALSTWPDGCWAFMGWHFSRIFGQTELQRMCEEVYRRSFRR